MINDPDVEADRPIVERVADGGNYGDSDDDGATDPSDLHSVAPPCDRCEEREAAATLRGDRDFCGGCATVVEAREEWLDWLTPTQRGDYVATEIEGRTQADRADDRDVEAPVISVNVSRAKERLQELAEERGDL